MYLRTIQRKARDGSVARYVRFAHNGWDPVKGESTARVVHLPSATRIASTASAPSGWRPRLTATWASTSPCRLPPAADDRASAGLRPAASQPAGGGGYWTESGVSCRLTALLDEGGEPGRAVRLR